MAYKKQVLICSTASYMGSESYKMEWPHGNLFPNIPYIKAIPTASKNRFVLPTLFSWWLINFNPCKKKLTPISMLVNENETVERV